ncbi:hypothetical protein HU200_030674 [Digitaria exilis]|uniref:Myb-like domain-containing protein n=1 Tax=Digitaria exilis TaxID=1010633 RepID=A0A835BZU2_9POAL|nr:hypothetical protein HU200_030674 [Digitaria exilis]
MDVTNEAPLEVTPLVKKKRARTGNYTAAEDEALVLAWENVSLDPITGTNQDGSTYWDRIADYYNRIVKSKSFRTTKSLQQRWCSIQECCNRWAGCMVSVEDNQPSGTTLMDLVGSHSLSSCQHCRLHC